MRSGMYGCRYSYAFAGSEDPRGRVDVQGVLSQSQSTGQEPTGDPRDGARRVQKSRRFASAGLEGDARLRVATNSKSQAQVRTGMSGKLRHGIEGFCFLHGRYDSIDAQCQEMSGSIRFFFGIVPSRLRYFENDKLPPRLSAGVFTITTKRDQKRKKKSKP